MYQIYKKTNHGANQIELLRPLKVKSEGHISRIHKNVTLESVKPTPSSASWMDSGKAEIGFKLV